MTLAHILLAWSGSKSGRNLAGANVMPSPCGVLLACVWTLLLGHNAWPVESLRAGQQLDSAVIAAVGGEKAADVWLPRFVFNRETICAGVTLTAHADLTSATCLNDDEPLDAFVVVESHGRDGTPVQVADVNRCVKVDKGSQRVHDLMVCFHHAPWNFSDDVFVPRINLDRDREPTEFDKTCRVMGFGHLTNDSDKCNVLYTLEVNVGTAQDCGSQDNPIQNYICGTTKEHQESCAVDGGEPLLCQHNGSGYLIHGICKQDCSAPQKYSKFILLSYYREWLERTVPGLAPSSGSQEDTSSHREEGDTKSEGTEGEAVPEQNNQRTDHAGGVGEKFPFLPRTPPIHLHHYLRPKVRTDEATPIRNEDSTSGSAIPNVPLSGDETVLDVTVSDIQNSDSTARQAVPSIEMPPANQLSSGSAQSVSVSGSAHNPGPVEAAASDSSDSNAALTAAATLPSDKSPESALPEPINANLHDTSPAVDKVPPNAIPVQTSPSEPATVASPNAAETVMNVTVLLASLSDGWYLSNATHSAPQLSDSNEKLDLDQLEKLISNNGAILNFSYVVDSSNISGSGFKNSSVETSAKLLSPIPAKSGADSTNSVPSNQMKSTSLKSSDSAGKASQIPLSKPQNVLPSDGVTPVQEVNRDRPGLVSANLPHADAPQDNVSSSAEPPLNLTKEAPRQPESAPPVPPNSMAITPEQWDWLTKNAMRIPKNPLKNAKILGKTLLFKLPRRKSDKALPAEQNWNRQKKELLTLSESSGFPSSYREKWSAQVMSYYRLHPSSHDTKTPQTDQSHALDKGVPITDPQVAVLRFHKGSTVDRSRRSLTNKGAHPSKPGDTRTWRNTIDRASPSGDTQHTNPGTATAQLKKQRQTPSSSANRRQPEGTFFGELSSSGKARLKRSGKPDVPSEWKTLLADLANWPAYFGIPPSELTPHVSFLTYINGTTTGEVRITPQDTLYHSLRLLKAFLPGGNFARRLDMLNKKLLWGPPITYDEFKPLKPLNTDVEPENQPVEEGSRLDEIVGEDIPEQSKNEVDPVSEQTVAYEGVNRKKREVQNDILTTPDPEIKVRTDGDSIGAELRVKTANHTAEVRNSSSNGSPNETNVLDQSDRADVAGTIDRAKEATHSTFDTGKDTTLPAVDTRKETTHSAVDIQKETTHSAMDTRKDNTHSAVDSQKETSLSAVDTREGTTLSAVDTQKETTGPAVDTRKETTGSAVDTRKETTLPEVNTQKETVLPTVNTQKEITIPTANIGKDKLLTVNTENETLPFQADTQKGTTLSKVSTQRETTSGAEIVSTPHTVDAEKQNLWPTVRRTIEIEEPSEDRYSTSFTDNDEEKEDLQVREEQNQEQADFYNKIKRLGTDEHTNAAQRLASILGVPLTLVLMWISMPQI